MTNNCPCYAGNRECDPNLCKRCQTCTFPPGIPAPKSKGNGSDKKCRNDHIRMRREIKGLYKAKSEKFPEAGLGLYCNEDIRQGAYIGEYVGELFSPEDKGIENNSYLFELPNGYIIDAQRTGNLTRYINDSKGDTKANAKAKCVKVDGDYHVAFLAKGEIPAHTE
eukprot:9081347-Ditylum_brightwellii.AAC.1